MGFSPIQGKMHDAVAMTANNNSDAVEALYVDAGSIQVVWATADAVDATVTMQSSHDGTNWDDIPSGAVTLDAASGSKSINLTNVNYPWIRAAFAFGSNTTGTVTTRYAFKSSRG